MREAETKGGGDMALTIQERLKDLRVERGLTLEQLAEQTNLSKSALGRGGGLTLLGAIFHWQWVTSPEGEKPNGPGRFIYDLFGQGGYCVFMGILGIMIIVCGIFFLFVGR